MFVDVNAANFYWSEVMVTRLTFIRAIFGQEIWRSLLGSKQMTGDWRLAIIVFVGNHLFSCWYKIYTFHNYCLKWNWRPKWRAPQKWFPFIPVFRKFLFQLDGTLLVIRIKFEFSEIGDEINLFSVTRYENIPFALLTS